MQPAERSGTNNLKIALAYLLMIGGVIIAYLMIRSYGERLISGVPIQAVKSSTSAAGSSSPDVMLHVLLALIVVIVLARTLGSLFRAIHQPPVIGEIIAGVVALGPLSFRTSGSERGVLRAFPASGCAPFLNVIAQVGIIL